MATYAKDTSVSSEASRAEIERTISRYGATQFAYGWAGERAMVQFVLHERQIRFVLPLPDQMDRQFALTPERGIRRTPKAQKAAWEQAVRQRWRALHLVVKAKLEAVESGVVTFEQEFGMFVVLPNGQTVGEQVIPAIEQAYLTGSFTPSLLQIESGATS
jgi:hypothetical protein